MECKHFMMNINKNMKLALVIRIKSMEFRSLNFQNNSIKYLKLNMKNFKFSIIQLLNFNQIKKN